MRKKSREEGKFISDELLMAEYSALYRYAVTLCKDEADAADLTQETFLRAMKAQSFRGESSLYSWLCSIAKHLWLNRLRKEGREVSPDDWDSMTADEGRGPEDALLAREQQVEIHRCLHELSEPYKEVFSLRVFGELSFRDIAELFGKTESWARVTYHRARKQLLMALERRARK